MSLQEPEQSYRLYPSLKVQRYSEPSLYLNKRILLYRPYLVAQTKTPPPAGATRCPNPQKLLQKTQSSTRIHTAIRATSRQFDTLRPPRQDTDRIQSRASHEYMQRFAPLCASAPPAAPTPAAFAQPPVSRDAPRIFLPNLTKISYQRSCLSTHQTAQTSFCCESHLKQRLFGRIWQLNRGRPACPYAIRNAPYATQQKAGSRSGRTLDADALIPISKRLSLTRRL